MLFYPHFLLKLWRDKILLKAPDSRDSLDDPGPRDTSEGASDLTENLHSLNVNTKPFVLNVNAPVFVPLFLKTQAANGKILLFIC